MQEKDIDDFLEAYLGNNMDDTKLEAWLDRMGISYSLDEFNFVEWTASLDKQITNLIKQNSKAVEYIKTKDKEVIGELVIDFPEIFDKEYLKAIIQDYQEYGLKKDIIRNLILKINEPEYTNKIVKDPERYGLDNNDLTLIIRKLPEEDRWEILKEAGPEVCRFYRINFATLEEIQQHFGDFVNIEVEDEEDRKEIKRIFEGNEEILKDDFRIFGKKYINLLGIEKVAQIASYPEVVEEVLQLSDIELNTVAKIIDTFLEETKGEEWTPLANRLLTNIGDYSELVSSLKDQEDIDYIRLSPILIHPNSFDIKTYQDVENFHQIKREKCESLINSPKEREKKEAVLLTIFGQSWQETYDLIKKFGEDIDKIGDKDLKSYIKSLQAIIDTRDPEVLKQLYDNVEGLEKVSPLLMERMLKTEYWKLYNKDLFRVEDAKKIPGMENMYSAGTDFKMIITSVGAYYADALDFSDNFKEDWNRPSLVSQFFCASYIRNDMLGHAKVPLVCYGFADIKEDSLVLAGPSNLSTFSNSDDLEPRASNKSERYLAPESQINQTRIYNEMDFRRIQQGQRKQPDYIVVFKQKGSMHNLEQAQKASKDFGGLPIVVIDEDECLASEKEKAQKLFKEYQETGAPEVKLELAQKIRNNRVTEPNFCSEMDEELGISEELTINDVIFILSRDVDSNGETKSGLDGETKFEPKTDSKLDLKNGENTGKAGGVSMSDLVAVYEEIKPMERQRESRKLKRVFQKIKSIIRAGKTDESR